MSTVIVSAERFAALEAEAQALREERDDLRQKLDRFYSQSHGIASLSEIERLNAEVAALLGEGKEHE